MKDVKEMIAVSKPEDEDDLNVRFAKGIISSIAGVLATLAVNALVDLYVNRGTGSDDIDEIEESLKA